MGQVREGPAQVGDLAVGRELLGDAIAVDRRGALSQVERADALRQLEQERLQAEPLA